MDNAGYTNLTRQSGLWREMAVVANNIANSITTGFRQEGITFSEYIKSTDNGPSLSMATANVRTFSTEQGALTETRGNLDFAIEGDGFFLIQAPEGERLTRAGAFALSNAGDLVTVQGYPVLDAGGAPLFIPTDAKTVGIAADGTLSADGVPVGQMGIVEPTDGTKLQRESGALFSAPDGFEASENPKVVQGFLESSNVNTVLQITRMIEIQRAYELGQSFSENEDERISTTTKTLMK